MQKCNTVVLGGEKFIQEIKDLLFIPSLRFLTKPD